MGKPLTAQTRAKIAPALKKLARERKVNKAGYEVGYGKPPKEYQFKPGHSGNPEGRPVSEVSKTPNPWGGEAGPSKYPFYTAPGYVDSSGAIRPLVTEPWIASPIGPAETRIVAYGWVLLWLVQWLDWLWGRLS